MSYVIGIDPGQTGAIVVVGDCGLSGVFDMPVIDKWINSTLLAGIIDEIESSGPSLDLAVVEKVRSMPGQGVASMFKFGAAWGMAVQSVAFLPIEEPSPAVWKKVMGLSKDKGASRDLAIKLWPSDADLFKRVKDDGRAEAALLAEYGRRLLVGRGQA